MNYQKFAWLSGKLAVVVLLVFTLALDRSSVARNVSFVAQYAPISGSMTGPFQGTMRLSFNRGAISGNYSDTSKLAQAPLFAQHNVAVVGGIDTEGNITLHIGPMSVRGTINGKVISGIAIVNGRKYNFRARPPS